MNDIISVIMPTYNNARYTMQAFVSLARTMQSPYEIVVVDNGSTDETLPFVGSHTPGTVRGKAAGGGRLLTVRLVHNDRPRTLSRSWNMGCDAAHGDYLLITNNDVIFSTGAVDRMAQTLREEWQYGVALPSNRWTARTTRPHLRPPDDGPHRAEAIMANFAAVEPLGAILPRRVRVVPDPYIPQGGYCFMTTRRAFYRVGRFDEDYELTGEDYDWFSRNRRYFKMALVEDAYVEHFEHTTCKPLADEYNERLCRSRFLLTEKREGIAEHFSIIMPNYNRVDTLRAAIDSVLAQTFQHWRLYIIDDASSEWDGISRLAREYDAHRNRLWFFRRPTRTGAGAARNYGLSLSRGKYVAFLDSDDLWYPNHLERHWQAHETANWAMVYGKPDFANRSWQESTKTFLYKVRPHPTIQYDGEFDPALLREKNYIQTSSMSVWGELARASQFPPELVVGEDWAYCKSVADVEGMGRPVLRLEGSTCRYHISKDPHEEDHLIKTAVPSLGSAEGEDETQEIEPMPAASVLGVVIPTRDRLEQITAALQSVAGVPFVVADDGGADIGRLAGIVRHYPKGGLLRIPVSEGPSAARNRAIERCAFEWIQFLDDDDLLCPDWEARLKDALTGDVDVVLSPAWVLAPDGAGLVESREVFTSQICVRRSKVLEAGGFDESCSWAEERDLLERMERMGARVFWLGAPLVTRPRRGGSGNRATAQGGRLAPDVRPTSGDVSNSGAARIDIAALQHFNGF